MNKKNPRKSKVSSEFSHIIQEIRHHSSGCKKIVFVQGDFNILHPGHLRFLNFAASCGDYLVVAVNGRDYGNTIIPEKSRLASVKTVDAVDFSFILKGPSHDFLKELKPHIVVKGKEFSLLENTEKEILNSYGGELLFSSGEVKFSNLNLLKKEFSEINFSTIMKPTGFLERHKFDVNELLKILKKFTGLKIVVIGDLIIDEYITCDPIGMSQEDPTIVVRPIKEDRFVGGAGIVAAHASQMGAKVTFFTSTNKDAASQFAEQRLREYGVTSNILLDETRPTTIKRRYQASKKTLLRVNHLRDHDISEELSQRQFECIKPAIDNADLLIFSDFNYGILVQSLVDNITAYCKERGVILAADSQSSSQVGDISRYKNVNLITPTEHESRIALQDFKSGIVKLTDRLMNKMNTEYSLLTLGGEGVFISNTAITEDNSLRTDRLPAFNSLPRDVSGAGDSLLTCAAMTLAVGGSIWQAAYMGSIAAACQVSRIGNIPLTAEEIRTEIRL